MKNIDLIEDSRLRYSIRHECFRLVFVNDHREAWQSTPDQNSKYCRSKNNGPLMSSLSVCWWSHVLFDRNRHLLTVYCKVAVYIYLVIFLINRTKEVCPCPSCQNPSRDLNNVSGQWPFWLINHKPCYVREREETVKCGCRRTLCCLLESNIIIVKWFKMPSKVIKDLYKSYLDHNDSEGNRTL